MAVAGSTAVARRAAAKHARPPVDENLTISNPDREPFRAAARSVYEEWADRVGGMAKIEEILSMGASGSAR